MSLVYLARHGETTWNAEGRYQGRLESPLSPRGEAQVAALATAFEQSEHMLTPQRIISSPLQRCRQTAAPLAAALGITIEIDERLIEIGHGTWEGLLRDEIMKRDSALYQLWRQRPAEVKFEGGETLADVAKRWSAFAGDLVKTTQSTLVVSHDAVVRIALLLNQQRPLNELWDVHVENAGFATFSIENNQLTLQNEASVEHLKALRASIAGQAL